MNLQTQVNKFVEELELKNYAKQTIKGYKCALTLFILCFKERQTPKHISQEEIKDYLRQSKSQAILKTNIGAIKCFYKYVVHQPMKFSYIEYPRKEKRLPRIFEVNEVREKILAIPNCKHKAILAIGLCCALRVSEACNLKVTDILRGRNLIAIRQSKGKKDRHTGISDSCLKIIDDYIMKFNPPDYLFEGQYGGRYSERSCEEIYHKYIDKETAYHTLRHIAITNMVDNDKNILAIGIAVGHTRPSTTAAYYHISSKFLTSLPTAI